MEFAFEMDKVEKHVTTIQKKQLSFYQDFKMANHGFFSEWQKYLYHFLLQVSKVANGFTI